MDYSPVLQFYCTLGMEYSHCNNKVEKQDKYCNEVTGSYYILFIHFIIFFRTRRQEFTLGVLL